MKKNVHFISGLPRSGSTLLSALLNQNPQFHAGVTTPVAGFTGTLQQQMSAGEFSVFFDDDRRLNMLRSLLDSYYADLPDSRVIFDTNRGWTGRMALLRKMYPDAKVICCVRDIGWIIDSIERLLNKHPVQLSKVFGFQQMASVYARIDHMMEAEKGLIGSVWRTLREAWFGEFADSLIVIPFDHLVTEPRRTIDGLYQALGLAPFDHDFECVQLETTEYDAYLGLPGLHTVKGRVAYEARLPCIPPDVLAHYASSSFWNQPDLNVRGVRII